MSHAVIESNAAVVPDVVDDDILYEVINGEVREKEPMGAQQVTLAFQLGVLLQQFVSKHKLGIVVSELLFILDEKTNLQRRPDAAYVSYSRWPENTVPNRSAWNVVPDLAVEVVSPTNKAEDMEERVGDYLAAGSKQVWVIYPQTGRIYVHTSPTNVHVLTRSDTLDGGDALPGFTLEIETLFAALTKPE